MICKEAIEQLYEYLDNELDEKNYLKINQHLDMCRTCCEKFEFEQALRNIVKDRTQMHKMPQYVKQSIIKQLSEMHEELDRDKVTTLKPEKSRVFGFFTLKPFYAIPAALMPLVILGLSVYFVFFRSVDDLPIVKGAAERHDSFVSGEMFLDLVSSDRDEMRRHFQNYQQVNFPVVVPRCKGREIKLVGCKSSNLAGRKSAYIGLVRKLNKISLEMIDCSGIKINSLKRGHLDGRAYYFGKHKGYNVVLWKKGNTLYSLTSTMRREELMRVANGAIYQHHD